MSEVSVLMGTYNERKKAYVAAAIDSILNQIFRDFEFIICDDGSEMEFYMWLRQYCRKDGRIRLLRNKHNHGLAYTLNRCLRHATGAYIARMDADDIAMQRRLEEQMRFLKEHKEYAMAGCSAYMIGEQGIWGVRRLEEIPVRESFLDTSPFIHPTVCIRKEILEKLHGYRQDPAVIRAEDYELFMRMYAKGYRGYNLQEVLFQYREEKDSYRRRKYRYRFHEARVRYEGFQKLGILKGHFRYVLKPFAAGAVPAWLMQKYRAARFSQR